MIEPTTYIRKPLYVKAVQVTTENFSELALWCQGEVFNHANPHERYIQVRVTNPMNPRQAQARVGDWILTSDRGYKIYTPKAFVNNFDRMHGPGSPAMGARQLFEEHAPPVETSQGEVAATLHQEAKEGRITAEEADAAIIATPLEPVTPPVGSGPMPTQPEPTDVEVKHVPAVPENLKDENIVYPEGHVHPEKTWDRGDGIEELTEEEMQEVDRDTQ